MFNRLFKKNANEIALMLIVSLSSAYLTSITHYSPFYFGVVFSVILSTIYSISIFRIKYDRIVNILLFIYVFFIIYYFINISITDTSPKNAYGLFFILFINQFNTIYVYLLCKNIKDRFVIKKSINLLFTIAVLVGGADLIYRWCTRLHFYTGRQYFYNFKMSSLLFEDSNWTGFIYMISFSVFLYLYDRFKMIQKNKLFILFIFILLSLSRAAIVSTILIIIYSNYRKLSRKKRFHYCIFISFLFCLIITPIFYYVTNDDSFQTKIMILDGFKYYFTHTPLTNLLLGFGSQFASSVEVSRYMNYSGVQGHLYLVQKIMDVGLIGLLLELLFFIMLIKFSRGYFIYILFPFLLCGLSMCPSNLSFFYIPAGIIIFLERSIRGDDNGFNQCNHADIQCRKLCCGSNRLNFESIIFKYRICDC